MNKKTSLLLTVLASLFIFSQHSTAAVIYLGDNVVEKVADKLQNAELDNINVSPLIYAPDKTAAILNHSDWLPQAKQDLNNYSVDAIVISLGKNDMRLRSSKFPSTKLIDKAISEIMNSVTSSAPVFWVIPHENAATRSTHKKQRKIIISALQRAQESGKYQDFYIVDLDFWASQNDIKLRSLLAGNKITFTNRGAVICADLIVSIINDFTAQ